MARLLLDANLSYRIKKLVSDVFPDVLHASAIPGHPLRDSELWEIATTEERVIVTRDEDFSEIQMLRGFPPKIIWLRFGNQSTVFVANKLLLHQNAIRQLITTDDIGVLEIY